MSTAPRNPSRQYGFTLIELTLTTLIAGMVMLSLGTLLTGALNALDSNNRNNEVIINGGAAITRMSEAIRNTRQLVLPLPDNPATSWREHVREQTLPASPAEPGSSFASAVLSVTLSPLQDLDNDGWADANFDKDYQDLNDNGSRDPGEPERIDEDSTGDVNHDGKNGILGIDDDGDGAVDEDHTDGEDDDEDGLRNEDWVDGIDWDGDGNIDEDPKKDLSGEAAPGLPGVDDDNDGSIDEGDKNDDDEDGRVDEDWRDTITWYLSGNKLIERHPVFYDVNGDSLISGKDYVETTLVEGVTAFRVARIAAPRGLLVDLSLTVSDGVSRHKFSALSRVGAGL